MKWYGWIIIIALLCSNVYFWNKSNINKSETDFFDKEYDSWVEAKQALEEENKTLYAHIDSVNIVIDSLIDVKQTIKIKYETKIQSFRDATVVTDDSVISFIADKIEDWKRYSNSIYK